MHPAAAYPKCWDRLKEIMARTESDYLELAENNPHWQMQDIRLLSIYKLGIAQRAIRVSLAVLADDLKKPTWYENVDIPKPNAMGWISETLGFDSFVRIGAIQIIQSVVESTLRVLLRAIAPGACKNGAGEFASVYECLIDKLSAVPPYAMQFLGFLRNIRNLVHNDGVYFDPDGLTQNIVMYRGNTYKFVHGTTVEFVYWELILDLMDDAEQFLMHVTKDHIIYNIINELTLP